MTVACLTDPIKATMTAEWSNECEYCWKRTFLQTSNIRDMYIKEDSL